ncbi:MAG: hypothetical protein ACK41T_08740 [Pseudobdellovibrio sp.]
MKKYIKLLILFTFALVNFKALSASACSDEESDSMIEKRAVSLSKYYKAEKFSISFASLYVKPLKTATIYIYSKIDEDPLSFDRIGTVVINMDNCTYHSSLVSMFKDYSVKDFPAK